MTISLFFFLKKSSSYGPCPCRAHGLGLAHATCLNSRPSTALKFDRPDRAAPLTVPVLCPGHSARLTPLYRSYQYFSFYLYLKRYEK